MGHHLGLMGLRGLVSGAIRCRHLGRIFSVLGSPLVPIKKLMEPLERDSIGQRLVDIETRQSWGSRGALSVDLAAALDSI